MNNEKPQLGVINEIGDLGLGFNPISEDDAKKIENKEKDEK